MRLGYKIIEPKALINGIISKFNCISKNGECKVLFYIPFLEAG
ncbi:MAG: hypothetical protein A370_05816 [Clostridium sp. Maddingley MBC34-26]|nr:MAG: hypothetical protein A370_05816 [Clostridium sp. Maddingley MBC34-26]